MFGLAGAGLFLESYFFNLKHIFYAFFLIIQKVFLVA